VTWFEARPSLRLPVVEHDCLLQALPEQFAFAFVVLERPLDVRFGPHEILQRPRSLCLGNVLKQHENQLFSSCLDQSILRNINNRQSTSNMQLTDAEPNASQMRTN